MFLVLHTSGLTIIPLTIISYRLAAGSHDAASIFIPCVLATIGTTLASILMVGLYQKLKWDKVLISWLLGLIGLMAGVLLLVNTLSPQNKEIVSKAEMVDRIKAAVDARTDENFSIMARTDAIANEGIEAAIERVHAYIEAGADLIFPEAIRTLEDYKRFSAAVSKPILANITEFGMTPLFTRDELAANGVGMILYPLSAFRAMNKAAENVYTAIRRDGTQAGVIDTMQTREELYQAINYYEYEKALDQTLGKDNG
jgi:hypothetical protein